MKLENKLNNIPYSKDIIKLKKYLEYILSLKELKYGMARDDKCL